MTSYINLKVNGILRKQGGLQKIIRTTSHINEVHVGDPGYLYLHHEKWMPNGIKTWNIQAFKGHSKQHTKV